MDEIDSILERLYDQLSDLYDQLSIIWEEGGEDPYVESMFHEVYRKIDKLEDKYNRPSKLIFYDLEKLKQQTYGVEIPITDTVDNYVQSTACQVKNYYRNQQGNLVQTRLPVKTKHKPRLKSSKYPEDSQGFIFVHKLKKFGENAA